jgi:hypothetical protein
MRNGKSDSRLTETRKDAFRKRAALELALARLQKEPYDGAEESANGTLARRALGMAAEAAAEVMMLLYYLDEDPAMKSLLLAISRLSENERRRIVRAIAEQIDAPA